MTDREYFCPNCGKELIRKALTHPLWLKVYECDSETCKKQYLKVMDMRNDYDLIETCSGIDENINSLSEFEAEEAWLKIKLVDCKTVSIIEFEKYVMSKK